MAQPEEISNNKKAATIIVMHVALGLALDQPPEEIINRVEAELTKITEGK